MLLLAWAYARAEAQRLAPVEFTGLIWAALLGYLVFGEEIGVATVLGAGLIVTGCVLATRKERIPSVQAEAAL
jgi:S-adenosylmethionine uptake transporter